MNTFSMVRGTSQTIEVSIVDSDGNPINVAASDMVVFGVKPRSDTSEYSIRKTIKGSDITNKKAVFNIGPTDTIALDTGRYFYDIGLKSGSSFTMLVPFSEFELLPNITSLFAASTEVNRDAIVITTATKDEIVSELTVKVEKNIDDLTAEVKGDLSTLKEALVNKANVSEVDAIKEDLGNVEEAVLGEFTEEEVYEDIPYNLQSGAYLQNGNFFDNNSYAYYIQPCTDGDVFKLYAWANGSIDGAVFFSDTPSASTKIGSLSPTSYPTHTRLDNVIVEVPNGCKYVVFNTYWGYTHDFSLKKRKIEKHYSGDGLMYRVEVIEGKIVKYDGFDEEINEIKQSLHFKSENLYNPSKQTSETISPHYYVSGVPYSSTQFDSQYNATALIEVEENTTYSVCMIPKAQAAKNNKPWNEAGAGLFFYRADGSYISGQSGSNTFTTPTGTKYIRFNWAKFLYPLAALNERCVLVKGDTVPTEYIRYYDETIADRINARSTNKIKYVTSNDTAYLITKYNDTTDLCIEVKKHGGNNIFDFNRLGVISNSTAEISDSVDSATWFLESSGDWHAPFVVKAKNNINGDHPTAENFTGGNHQYNNTGSGSTPTGRTSFLKFIADGKPVVFGKSGSCNLFEMQWVNMVQGYNTSKENGSGREILKETHRMVYDGVKFETYVDVIALEDIEIKQWYGFQWFNLPYRNIRYIGGTNRAVYDAYGQHTDCGDNKTNVVYAYGTEHEMTLSVDKNYGIGDFSQIWSSEKSVFTEIYGKGYFSLVRTKELLQNEMFSAHATYEFRPLSWV